MGNVWEDFLFGFLENKEEQVKFKLIPEGLKFPISGKIDCIYKGGLELKSTFGRAINYIKSKGAKEEHKAQVCCYLFCTDLTSITLLYFARDSGFMFPFVFTRDDLKDLWVKILERLKKLEKNLEDNILPQGEFAYVEWQCKWCPYLDKCRGER